MKKIITVAFLLGPLMALAQPQTGFGETISLIWGYVAALVPLLLTIAVVVFLWGLVKFIANTSDEKAKEAGKSLMIWGLVALFVMVSFWGILGYIENSLGLGNDQLNPASAPEVNLVPTAVGQ